MAVWRGWVRELHLLGKMELTVNQPVMNRIPVSQPPRLGRAVGNRKRPGPAG